MPLDLLNLSSQVHQMGDLLVKRRAEEDRRMALAQRWLQQYADRWEELSVRAEQVPQRVAVPTGPLDEVVAAPPRLATYTAMATDGSEIEPDRHGATGNYYVINIGRVRIPYGQPEREVELRSVSDLGFTDEQLFIVDPRDTRRQVPVRDRHLDALRTVAELKALADLAETEAEQHGDVPIVALVDGTLLFSVLEERPRDFLRARFYGEYVTHLERLRQSGAVLAAYASRSRGLDVVSLFRTVCGVAPDACEVCGAEASSHNQPACALRGLMDAHLLGPLLGRWDRSSLFRVRSNVHDPYFGEHRVYFFLLDTGDELARVEVPEWVARDQTKLRWLQAALVDQCAKGFGYPAVLARADDRAVLSQRDRQVLDTLVRQELTRRGINARASAKLSRKQIRTV
jgi:hypothetical protein